MNMKAVLDFYKTIMKNGVDKQLDAEVIEKSIDDFIL